MTSRFLLLAGTALTTAFALSSTVLAQSAEGTAQTEQTAQVDAPKVSAPAKKKVVQAAAGPSMNDLQRQLDQLRLNDQAQIRALQQEIEQLKAAQQSSDRKLEVAQERVGAANAELVKAVDDVKKKASAAPSGDSLTWNGITLYGTYDIGVSYLTHGAPASDHFTTGLNYLVRPYGRNEMIAVAPSPLSGSKLGIRGSEKLIDDWSAVFNVEQQFIATSGQSVDALKSLTQANGVPTNQKRVGDDSSRGNELFNGAAYAGVSSLTYGTLTLGRQVTLQNSLVSKYDPMGGSYAFSYVGWDGTTAGAGRTQTTRFDNSIKYTLTTGPVHFGAIYRTGGDVGGANGSGWQANVGGEYGGFSVDALYSKIHDVIQAGSLSAANVATLIPGTTAAAAASIGPSLLGTTVSGTISDNEAYGVDASFVWDEFKFTGGYEHINYANPVHPMGGVTSGVPITPITDMGYTIGIVNNAAYTIPKKYDIFFLGGKYSITPKLDVLVAWYHLDQNNFAPASAQAICNGPNPSGNSACQGTLDAYSLVVDYKLSKRFDVYAGAMYSTVADGVANGYLSANNFDPTIGMRFNF